MITLSDQFIDYISYRNVLYCILIPSNIAERCIANPNINHEYG